ncbi:hypothetical protein, partial [Legionella sp. 28fT52]|uniref:hypothetical protein n=1 Tax=Legionella sp. 28fT52 TaxID=3410134 RepID=UPI003AF494C4
AQDDMSVIYIKIPFAYFKGDFNSIMKFFYTDLCRRFSCLQPGYACSIRLSQNSLCYFNTPNKSSGFIYCGLPIDYFKATA